MPTALYSGYFPLFISLSIKPLKTSTTFSAVCFFNSSALLNERYIGWVEQLHRFASERIFNASIPLSRTISNAAFKIYSLLITFFAGKSFPLIKITFVINNACYFITYILTCQEFENKKSTAADLRCCAHDDLSLICKPSSVVYGHLSNLTVACKFKRY